MRERSIRLLTANLLHGRAHPAAFARLLEERAVDVVALQELDPDQAAAVAEVLPFGKLEPSAVDFNGMGIALRRPAEVNRLPLPVRAARVAALSPGEWPELREPLEILNVHIQAPHSGWPWATLALRRRQVEGVTSYLSATPSGHRVVMGDFNSTPLWPAYRRLRRFAEDVVASHGARTGTRPRRTWGPWPGAPRLLRIDHVLAVGPRVLHAETVEIEGSDHHGVLLDVAAPDD